MLPSVIVLWIPVVYLYFRKPARACRHMFKNNLKGHEFISDSMTTNGNTLVERVPTANNIKLPTTHISPSLEL